ncbi:GNAT family N-acetyltransferase [Rhodococcus sp. JS3073]|uniref:GNAT family N-acetyltransferase n=1 Tax=Rhodococcus sp. JS3073 TaxID=3002901 RepID=UPI0022866C90|nr:GNAT family N-acetyltransferase [Rhodococcus sp. JS3073]WAM19182.1 GNAT family N-acetyltransferase [Rhodococcus sp. JS3073]
MRDRVVFRKADRVDLPRIVELIADDVFAAEGTGEFGDAHICAFDAIEASANDELVIAELDDEVVGVMQLTFVPGLSRNGATRLQIEAVRVDSRVRGRGIGRLMMEYARTRGRERGCVLAQLTSGKERADAHRFYRALGYAQSHEGFKLGL